MPDKPQKHTVTADDEKTVLDFVDLKIGTRFKSIGELRESEDEKAKRMLSMAYANMETTRVFVIEKTVIAQ